MIGELFFVITTVMCVVERVRKADHHPCGVKYEMADTGGNQRDDWICKVSRFIRRLRPRGDDYNLGCNFPTMMADRMEGMNNSPSLHSSST